MSRNIDKIAFASPPIKEFVLGVQFRSLELLSGPLLGLFFAEIKGRYPIIETKEPVARIEVPVGIPKGVWANQVRFNIQTAPQMNRFWFLSEDRRMMLQIQRDRFVLNWIRRDMSDEFPGFDNLLRQFDDELGCFQKFLEESNLGFLSCDHTETTYVNHIPLETGEDFSAQIGRILTVFNHPPSTDQMSQPVDDFSLRLQKVVKDERGRQTGRLQTRASLRFEEGIGRPVLVLHLTMIRRLIGSGETRNAFDTIKNTKTPIMHAFLEMTTEELHQRWGIS